MHPRARSAQSFAHPTGPNQKPRNDDAVSTRRAAIQPPPAQLPPTCACPHGGHAEDVTGGDPPVGAAARVAPQEPRLTAASQHPMEHEAFSGDGKHDFAPSRQARLESHAVSRS
ncbi:MAG TPA: hypothetical protein VKM54_26540 [Myxococcota bacterium]|nr:hypothetical protein [Myxococcota bacterium]